MSISEVLFQSVVGLALVFVVLAILMFIIELMSAIFKAMDDRKKPAAAAASTAPAPAAGALPGRGSCGEVKLYDVPDATAAMLMAIVADEMKAPLNELRFISIKEVEDESK